MTHLLVVTQPVLPGYKDVDPPLPSEPGPSHYSPFSVTTPFPQPYDHPWSFPSTYNVTTLWTPHFPEFELNVEWRGGGWVCEKCPVGRRNRGRTPRDHYSDLVSKIPDSYGRPPDLYRVEAKNRSAERTHLLPFHKYQFPVLTDTKP